MMDASPIADSHNNRILYIVERSRTSLCPMSSASLRPGAVQEYCHMETFQPRCTHGDVISMTTAMFGRMRVGRCIESDALQLQHPDSLGCSADVLGYFDRVCSGKSSCDVLVPNPDLYSYRPCSAHLSMYLEASYVCVTCKYCTWRLSVRLNRSRCSYF